jgi:guanylate kinase
MKKYYKYSLSFDEEMGEFFEEQRDRFPKRSVSKTVQAFMQPSFDEWLAIRRLTRVSEHMSNEEVERRLRKSEKELKIKKKALNALLNVAEQNARYGGQP